MTAHERKAFWEGRYAESDRIWSGEVNRTLESAVGSLEPGTSLDLGCGEGGDTLWLAGLGWRATGVDISQTAVSRARARAAELGLAAEAADAGARTAADTSADAGSAAKAGSAEFIVADLSTWRTDRQFDLVTASFLNSPVEFPRAEVLRRAADQVLSGGHFVLVSHATAPPWSKRRHSHEGPPLPALADELKELSLDPALWQTITAEVRQREAQGPGGETAVIEDNLIVMRRRPPIDPER